MNTTTAIHVNDWFFNKFSNDELRDMMYEFADALNVRTRVNERAGRCTIANELERMDQLEAERDAY